MCETGVPRRYSRLFPLMIAPALLLTGCISETERQKLEFAEHCAQVETLGGIDFTFSGFTYDELKEVTVEHERDGKVIERFALQVDTYSFKSGENNFSLYDYSRPLYVRDKYNVTVSDKQTFVLNGMKTKVMPQFTALKQGAGCHLSGYYINGVSVESYASPVFVKLEIVDDSGQKSGKKRKKKIKNRKQA